VLGNHGDALVVPSRRTTANSQSVGLYSHGETIRIVGWFIDDHDSFVSVCKTHPRFFAVVPVQVTMVPLFSPSKS